MKKIKVSAFEYAIMEAVNKKGVNVEIEKYEPLTSAEEFQRREENINSQIEKIKRHPEA